jgi:hypothetical protein
MPGENFWFTQEAEFWDDQVSASLRRRLLDVPVKEF